MTATLTSRALAFRVEHGDPATWTAADFEAHQHLALVDDAVRRDRWRRPLRRMVAGLLMGYAVVPLMLADAVAAARGGWLWMPAERHLDRVGGRLTAVREASLRAGDRVLAERMDEAADWLMAASARLWARTS